MSQRFLPSAALLLLLSVPTVRGVLSLGSDGESLVGTFLHGLQTAAVALGNEGWGVANHHLETAMDDFERALEEGSPVLNATLPAVQALKSGWGGAGNEKVYIGHGGYLFYRPGVDYLAGRPFLCRHSLCRPLLCRGDSSQRALVDLARQLSDRGIDLLLLPVPTKAQVHPDALAPSLSTHSGATHLNNPSFAAWRAFLEERGIEVLDPLPILAASRETGPVFLRTDSHWSPGGLDAVALAVAERIRSRDFNGPTVTYSRRPEIRRAHGDLTRVLRLQFWSNLYPQETVNVPRVLAERGRRWRVDNDAEILLLGDSFSNIYSDPSLGWGNSAGLAEQLSFYLQRPLDRITINDGSATEVRRRLARELAEGKPRLAGKKWVIYQLSVRELAFSDWSLVELPTEELPVIMPPPRQTGPS